MAYKGSLMVNDDEMFASFRVAPRSAPFGACREWRRGRGHDQLLAEGNDGPEGHAFSPASGRGRGHQPGDHDRRHGRGAALCGPCLLRGEPRGDPPGAGQGMRVMASR